MVLKSYDDFYAEVTVDPNFKDKPYREIWFEVARRGMEQSKAMHAAVKSMFGSNELVQKLDLIISNQSVIMATLAGMATEK